MTLDGRFFARLVLVLDGLALIALGVLGAVRNGLTPREVTAGCVLLVVAVVAAFWLRRDRCQHGGQQ